VLAYAAGKICLVSSFTPAAAQKSIFLLTDDRLQDRFSADERGAIGRCRGRGCCAADRPMPANGST
jgi:hypothetical protein